MHLNDVSEALLFLLMGLAFGGMIFYLIHRIKLGNYQAIAREIIRKAELDANQLRQAGELHLKQLQMNQQREVEQLLQMERKKNDREEERLKQREDKLEHRTTLLEKKVSEFEQRNMAQQASLLQFEKEKEQLKHLQKQLLAETEKLSGLSSTEAKELLFSKLTAEVQAEASHFTRRVLREAEEEAEKRAKKIVATAINRLAVDCVSEATVNTISIPDEMKGRIIGREGRNIRTLEKETGINFIVDETPGALVLSGYDPIRMHVAKMTLQELLIDGRIYPTRIEEVVERTKAEIKKQIKEHGEEAAMRAGVMNLHPEIILLLGKLKFRYSYGQNVLEHSLEVAHLMGMIAAELGLDVRLAKRIGLLHDMGKAVTHEMEGSHAMIGYQLALKFGELEEVANGIGAHHFEIEPITVEGGFCNTADAISASRIGARSEAVEQYINRLASLEKLALTYPGVEEAYAMQAGREIRVMVCPHRVDDSGVNLLAKQLTKRIEEEMTYSGKIKVLVIRQCKAVGYAI